MSQFRQSATARAPTRAQRTTAFWLENAASRETSRDDLAVDARTAHFADIATLVVHIADVDLRAPVRQSPRVTFNRANRAGIAQNRRVRARLLEIRLQRLLIGYVAAASGKENAEHDQGDPTHSVRRLKQASSAGLPGDSQRACAGKMASRSSQLHRSGRCDIRTRACTSNSTPSNSTPRAAVALWWNCDSGNGCARLRQMGSPSMGGRGRPRGSLV